MKQTTNSHITDVIIHTEAQLDDEQFARLSKQVYGQLGVVSMSRNVHTPRFLMVVYNAASVKARHILDTVTDAGYRASLVGI
jgi:hypothetical protein